VVFWPKVSVVRGAAVVENIGWHQEILNPRTRHLPYYVRSMKRSREGAMGALERAYQPFPCSDDDRLEFRMHAQFLDYVVGVLPGRV